MRATSPNKCSRRPTLRPTSGRQNTHSLLFVCEVNLPWWFSVCRDLLSSQQSKLDCFDALKYWQSYYSCSSLYNSPQLLTGAEIWIFREIETCRLNVDFPLQSSLVMVGWPHYQITSFFLVSIFATIAVWWAWQAVTCNWKWNPPLGQQQLPTWRIFLCLGGRWSDDSEWCGRWWVPAPPWTRPCQARQIIMSVTW